MECAACLFASLAVSGQTPDPCEPFCKRTSALRTSIYTCFYSELTKEVRYCLKWTAVALAFAVFSALDAWC